MHPKGSQGESSKPDARMQVTDNEIKERYLDRAIRELNSLGHEIQECSLCPRGNLMPVLGSGHPLAEIFVVKYAPKPAEVEEGVAFYGRSGLALLKSLKRLNIDPLSVYGTLCIKCPVADSDLAAPECIGRLRRELGIVEPRMVVVMGSATLEAVNELELPLSRRVEDVEGEIQLFTPTTSALVVPDIDECLDEQDRKQEFWKAFQALGSWYAELPPY